MDWIEYARTLLLDNGLTGWSAEISRGRRTIGLCRYRDKTIYLSKHHIENDSYDDVRDTVIHEVAHALNPLDGHGNKWRKTAMSMGGTGVTPTHQSGQLAASTDMSLRSSGGIRIPFIAASAEPRYTSREQTARRKP